MGDMPDLWCTGGKVWYNLGSHSMVWGSPGLQEWVAPTCCAVPSRGREEATESSKSWCQLSAPFCHKLQIASQFVRPLSWKRTGNGKSVTRPPPPRGSSQVPAAGVPKTWSLETQLRTWDKKAQTQAGWRQGSDRNQGHKRGDYCYSVRAPKKWGLWAFSPGAREQGVTIFIPPMESLQGAKQCHLMETRATYTKSHPLYPREVFPLKQVSWRISAAVPSPRRAPQTTCSHQVCWSQSAANLQL